MKSKCPFLMFCMPWSGRASRWKRSALHKYGEALSGRIVQLEKSIHEKAGEDFNVNSPKQLGEILFGKLGLPGGKKTKTGYSTAADVLEKLAPDYPIVNEILEYQLTCQVKVHLCGWALDFYRRGPENTHQF